MYVVGFLMPKLIFFFQRRYTAPPNQAGLKLKSIIGYNGNGRDNMVWHPDTGRSIMLLII